VIVRAADYRILPPPVRFALRAAYTVRAADAMILTARLRIISAAGWVLAGGWPGGWFWPARLGWLAGLVQTCSCLAAYRAAPVRRTAGRGLVYRLPWRLNALPVTFKTVGCRVRRCSCPAFTLRLVRLQLLVGFLLVSWIGRVHVIG